MGWQFNGTSDYVTIADNTGLTLPDGDWTIAFWVNPELTGSALFFLLGWGAFDAFPSFRLRGSQASFGLSSGVGLSVRDSVGSDIAGFTAANKLTDDTWQHVSIERSGTTFSIYVDDVLAGSDTNADVDAVDVSGSFYFGRRPDTASAYFEGTMAEFAIWTDADSSRRTALASGASYDDYTTNRTQYVSMRDGYTEEDQSATVTNNGTTEDVNDHPPIDAVITAPFISSGETMFAPTFTPGGVAVTAPLISSGEALYSPTVSPGNVSVTVPLIASGEALYGPTVSPGSVTLTLPTISSGETLYAPGVEQDFILTLPFIASGETMYAPIFQQDGSISLPFIASAETLYAPSLIYGQPLTLPLITSGETMYAPTFNPEAISITLPSITSSEVMYSPSVVVGPAILSLPFITSGETLYGPTVSPGVVSIALPLLGPTGVMYAPAFSTAQNMSIPLIASVIAMYAPTIAFTWQSVDASSGISWGDTDSSSATSWGDIETSMSTTWTDADVK